MDCRKAPIAMSGGVDSSVAAYLLQQTGICCEGAIMRLYAGSHSAMDIDGSQASQDGIDDAAKIADRLNMKFHVLDCTQAFNDQVIRRFIDCYECGQTPNPCVDCNRHLKFDLFLQHALKLGCNYVATGHYARIKTDSVSGRHLLYKATDPTKDQSYFLYTLNQFQLSHVLFPLGDLTKQQVRQIAQEEGFINAKKQDSQDICFIPDGDYLSFMKEWTGKAYPCGDFLDRSGQVVGQHQGAVGYTIGQRKGLGLAMGEPVYVCAKDMENNTVTVGPNEALFHTTLRARNWNWFPFETLTTPLRVMAKARSRMAEQPATVYPEEDGAAVVVFDEPQRALTPGQAVVLYNGEMVVGGGTIQQIL
jgi:tRNA-specific 2-thiouridylase